MTKFIAIASGKGGVGKTTTSLNLGAALTNFGGDVVVLDADLEKPNISLHLGTPKLDVTLNDAIKGKTSITNAAYLHPSGLKIIPSCVSIESLDELQKLDPMGVSEKVQSMLLELIGTVDVVLLDTPNGLKKENLSLMGAADEVIIVTSPDLPSVMDSLKTIKMLEDNGTRVSGAIINRVALDDGELSASNIEAMLEKKILGIIPEDSTAKQALMLRHPVVYSHPESAMSVGFKSLAANLMGQEYRSKI